MPKPDTDLDNDTARIMRRARDLVKGAGGELTVSVVSRLIAEEVAAARAQLWAAIGCSECDGSGWIATHGDAGDDCPACGGRGVNLERTQ